MVVALGAYFGVDMTPLVDRLLGEQLPDGGWNCEVEIGCDRSSFGTTINVLEGLLEHEQTIGGSAEVRGGAPGGEAYLLERRLFGGKRPATSSTTTACSSRSRPGGTTTSCAGSTTSAPTGERPDPRIARGDRPRPLQAAARRHWPLENTHRAPPRS